MCGNDTQSFHAFAAFSSGLYSTVLRGLAMLNGGSQTSTGYGYHWAALAAPRPNAIVRAAATGTAARVIAISLRWFDGLTGPPLWCPVGPERQISGGATMLHRAAFYVKAKRSASDAGLTWTLRRHDGCTSFLLPARPVSHCRSRNLDVDIGGVRLPERSDGPSWQAQSARRPPNRR